MKRIVAGCIAHVDAGKTTLSEAMLYTAGRIKKLGRVDHRDSFFDTHDLEKERGVTIYSNQAAMEVGSLELTLADTPGHVDFSAEMERVVQILDYAILVISGSDGVQSHTETLWQLLERYEIPTFVFVTKMDMPENDRDAILTELQTALSHGIMEIKEENGEEMALLDEEVMESYLKNGKVSDEEITALVRRRKLFPCVFGSGLRLTGVAEFLSLLERYTEEPMRHGEFGARVYKIARDPQGNRLTYLKVTGGSVYPRMALRYEKQGGDNVFVEEKINQVRVYGGDRYEGAERVRAGLICAVTGLTATYPGQGLGAEAHGSDPVLEPYLSYRLRITDGTDIQPALEKLRQLTEEDPLLRISWINELREIRVQLMGEIQTEVLETVIRQRFGMEVKLDAGRIMYKETIADAVEGVGHFEPLRHYAEVHLLLEPLPQGSGIRLETRCGEDVLDKNWQRLIHTHLVEKQHVGVLTGSPVTDMRITLLAGRAHLKHTEGGDFRQATYRAVRQGLMQAKSILLEPWYRFYLAVPGEQIGRAINDIRSMQGEFSAPDAVGDMMAITGKAPVSAMEGYLREVMAYTHGRGRFRCHVMGYFPCHNTEEVLAEIGYDPESDLENPADSVFCAHGAGFNVKWDQVKDYMHIDTGWGKVREDEPVTPRVNRGNLDLEEKELEAIMLREFGPIKRPIYSNPDKKPEYDFSKYRLKKDYLIVDGYNVIFAWPELKKLAAHDLEAARLKLMDTLGNYKGFTQSEIVLVFDAYKVKEGIREPLDHHGVMVVFTKERETGDAYIERLINQIGENYAVRVVTSDGMIQLSAVRKGVLRMSAAEFLTEVERVEKEIRSTISE